MWWKSLLRVEGEASEGTALAKLRGSGGPQYVGVSQEPPAAVVSALHGQGEFLISCSSSERVGCAGLRGWDLILLGGKVVMGPAYQMWGLRH